MALQVDFNLEEGLVTDAYIKVSFSENIHREKIQLIVETYASSVVRGNFGVPRDRSSYWIPFTQDMTLADAYAYLKTLPEFSAATDV